MAVLALTGAAVFTVRGHLPDPGLVTGVLRAADPRWAAAALLAQLLSQAAFAAQQRDLLRATGVPLSRRDALAITYSRSAISMAVPAGTAVSAAFAMTQFRRRGASTGTAATVTVLSGLASAAGLLALSAAAFAPAAVTAATPRVAAAVLLLAAGLVAGLAAGTQLLRRHRRPPRTVPAQARRHQPPTGNLDARAGRLRWVPGNPGARAGWLRWAPGNWGARAGWLRWVAGNWGARAGRYRRLARELGPRAGAVAVGWSAVNWLLDALCLVAAARACTLALSWHAVAVAYLAAQLARQIPLTPGGLGFLEASLVAGLSLHGPSAVAAAAVLGYRLVSFWLILPAGLAAYLVLSRHPAPTTGKADTVDTSAPVDAPLY